MASSANVAADLWKIALVTGLCQICFYYNDLYDLTVVHSSRELLIRLLQAAGAASIIIALLYLAMPSLAIGNGIFVSSLVIFLVAIIAWRLLFNRLAYASHLEERVLIVGSGTTARMVARQIQAQHDFGYRVVGFVTTRTTATACSTRRCSAAPRTSRASSRTTTSIASSSACPTAAAGCRSPSCCRPSSRASRSRTRRPPTSG